MLDGHVDEILLMPKNGLAAMFDNNQIDGKTPCCSFYEACVLLSIGSMQAKLCTVRVSLVESLGPFLILCIAWYA